MTKAKKCGFLSGHKWPRTGRKMKNGKIQKKCARCGRVRNFPKPKCGFFNPHRYHRDRRRKDKVLVCKKCGDIKNDLSRWTLGPA